MLTYIYILFFFKKWGSSGVSKSLAWDGQSQMTSFLSSVSLSHCWREHKPYERLWSAIWGALTFSWEIPITAPPMAWGPAQSIMFCCRLSHFCEDPESVCVPYVDALMEVTVGCLVIDWVKLLGQSSTWSSRLEDSVFIQVLGGDKLSSRTLLECYPFLHLPVVLA